MSIVAIIASSGKNRSPGGVIPDPIDPPIANFSPQDTNICMDDCISFTDESTGTNISSWEWTFIGANPTSSSTQNPTNICYPTAGNYAATLKVTDDNGTDSKTLQIAVEDCSEPDPIPEIGLEQYRKNIPSYLPVTNADFFKDVPYGDHPLENFDLILPEGQTNVPLLIFWHSGGFKTGTYYKKEAYSVRNGIDVSWDIPADIGTLIANGVGFMTMGYKLCDPAPGGVIYTLQEIYDRINYGVQFIKYHSEELRFNKNRIITTGISAGSIFSQYSFFKGELNNPQSSNPIERESTLLHSIAIRYVHSTDNPPDWNDVFYDQDFDARDFYYGLSQGVKAAFDKDFEMFWGVTDFEQFFEDDNIKQIVHNTNPIDYVDINTREFWFGSWDDRLPVKVNNIGHHAFFARFLSQRAQQFNVEHTAIWGTGSGDSNLVNPEDWMTFVLRKAFEL